MTIIYLFVTAAVVGFLMGLVYERTRLQAAHEQRQREAREALEYLQSTYGGRVVGHSRVDFERRQQEGGQPIPPGWREPDDE